MTDSFGEKENSQENTDRQNSFAELEAKHMREMLELEKKKQEIDARLAHWKKRKFMLLALKVKRVHCQDFVCANLHTVGTIQVHKSLDESVLCDVTSKSVVCSEEQVVPVMDISSADQALC